MKNKELTEKDVCIVIPTYNRAEEVNLTLDSLLKNNNIPGKIIVVDQSKDNETKKVVEKYNKNLPITYLFSKTPSSSIAKNKGVEIAKEKFDLILILDDDVDLLQGYITEAIKQFNENSKLMALSSGKDISMTGRIKSKLSSFFLKIFFLPYTDKRFKVTGPYGIVGNPRTENAIKDAEWLPGFNILFRKEVFSDYEMPESKGYNVLEDIDASYYVFKKYGKGSVWIYPDCKAKHRASISARYEDKKRIFVNHEDHFYFYYQYFPEIKDKIKFVWEIIGILSGHLAKSIFKPTKKNFSTFYYNFQAIKYSIKHKENIKKGILREFLNEDLTMKKYN